MLTNRDMLTERIGGIPLDVLPADATAITVTCEADRDHVSAGFTR